MNRLEMRQLHRLYSKHDYRLVAKAWWEGSKEDVHYCECGAFSFIQDGKCYEYSRQTNETWVVSTVQALEPAMRRRFRAWYSIRQSPDLNPEVYQEIFNKPMPPKHRYFRRPNHAKQPE